MDAHAWEQRYADHDPLWGAAPEAAVVEFVTARPAGRALDLGCGEGRHSLWLALRAWQVTAVDASRTALARSVRAAAPLPRATRARLTWVNADVTATAFEPVHDLVLACHVPVSRESRSAFLRVAVDALSPAGALLVLAFADPDASTGHDGFGCTPEELTRELDDRVTITDLHRVALDLPRDRSDRPAADVRNGTLVVGFRRPVGSELNDE